MMLLFFLKCHVIYSMYRYISIYIYIYRYIHNMYIYNFYILNIHIYIYMFVQFLHTLISIWDELWSTFTLLSCRIWDADLFTLSSRMKTWCQEALGRSPQTLRSRYTNHWLVVSNPLKSISQLGWIFPIYGKIKHVPNHQPVYQSWSQRYIPDLSYPLAMTTSLRTG